MSEIRQGISCELWLKKVGWDSSVGGTLTFEVSDEVIEVFKGLRTREGKKLTGQRFAAAMVLIGDDEKVEAVKESPALKESHDKAALGNILVTKPDNAQNNSQPKAKRHFPDGLCGLAIRWCDDPHFAKWVNAQAGETADPKAYILAICGIGSRKELNKPGFGADAFREEIMNPYMAQRKADGIDEGNF